MQSRKKPHPPVSLNTYGLGEGVTETEGDTEKVRETTEV